MSQTLLTSFFTVRKASSQEDKLKQNPTHGKVATVKKRKREDEEAENFSLYLSEDEEGVDNENREFVEDWEGEQGDQTNATICNVVEPVPSVLQTPTAASKTGAPQQESQLGDPVCEGKKNKVTFHKLSGLSPKKAVRGSWSGANSLARAETTPQHSSNIKPPSPKRPAVSRNLFSDEDELHLKKRTEHLASAVKTATVVKAKLTPAEVKAKLGNVKLKDLKARLASLDSSKKANTASSGPVKVTSKPPPGPPAASSVLLELDTPPCTPRKTILPTTPKKQEKASPRKLPAFQRFHNLTQPLCKVLPLPYKYRMLAEVFQAVDTIVSLHFNRNDPLSVSKLEEEARRVTCRPWLPSNLPQIRCLFPEAFKFVWVANPRGHTTTHTLRVTPNLEYRASLRGQSENENQGQSRLTSEDLVQRKQIFQNALLQLVKDQHATFLASLVPPITVADSLLTAWHKDFPLDECNSIDEIPLPLPGLQGEASSAGIGEAGSLREEKVKEEETEKENSPTSSNTTSSLPQSLLEKVRAKEAAKAVREMTRTEEEKKRIERLRRMPDLARKMRTLLISERRAAVNVRFAVTKLLALAPHGADKLRLEDDLRQLSSETDGWLSIHRVAMEDHFKIAKPHRINKIVELLEYKLAKALK